MNDSTTAPIVTLHLRRGWWLLAIFLSLGIVLEAMHAFKVPLYMGAENETRRLMWTLAHAHGTLLALVHLAFAATLWARPAFPPPQAQLCGRLLTAAAFLIPVGFFGGGIKIYAGDPGLFIALVPLGAIALLLGSILAARGVRAE